MKLRSGSAAAASLEPAWTTVLDDHVQAVAIAPDGRTIAAASVSGPISILDAATGAARVTVPGHGMGTNVLAWHRDGSILASGGQDGVVRLWEPGTGAPARKLEGGGRWVAAIAWNHDGTLLATAADRELRVWTPDGSMIAGWTNSASTISDLGWKPGSTILASSGYGGITLARPGGDKPPRVFAWKGSILVLAWSPDGRFIATGDQDSTVHFWYAQQGKDLQMWGYETKVRDLAWDHTSRYLATGGGSTIVHWDCKAGPKGPEGSTPRMLAAHESYVSALAYQGAGPLLASGGYDGLVGLWAPHRTKRLLSGQAIEGAVSAIRWAPDDRWLVVGGSTGTVTRFDLA